MRPACARSCSSRTLPSLARSTILNLPVEASSLVSMPARSRPASVYHQLADVSLVNSATPTDGFSEPKAIVVKTRVAARKRILVVRICHLSWILRPSLYGPAADAAVISLTNSVICLASQLGGADLDAVAAVMFG